MRKPIWMLIFAYESELELHAQIRRFIERKPSQNLNQDLN